MVDLAGKVCVMVEHVWCVCVCVLVSEREIKEDSDEMILLLLVSAPRENRQSGGVGGAGGVLDTPEPLHRGLAVGGFHVKCE